MPTWAFPSFLAQPHLQGNALLLFGGLLLAGLLAGALATRLRWLPRLSGYFLVGVLLGAGGLNWLTGDVLALATEVADLAIAVMVYQLGRYVDLSWLRRERWLLATVLLYALLCVGLVWWGLRAFGIEGHLAALAAVFAIGIGPAVVMVVVRDSGAEGQLTRRLAAMTALSNLVALLAAYILLPLVSSETKTRLLDQAAHTVYSLLGALLLAYLTLQLLIFLARLLGRGARRQYLLVLAVITLIVGASQALQLPLLLCMLAFSILSTNADTEHEVVELDLGPVGELLVVMLFVTIGATVSLPSLMSLAIPVAVLLAMRALAVTAATLAFAWPARLSWRQAGLLSIASLPLTEAGLGLLQVAHLYPQTSAAVAPLIAASLAVMEFFGPAATQFALTRAGETAQRAPL